MHEEQMLLETMLQNVLTAGMKLVNLDGHDSVVVMLFVLQVQQALFCIVHIEWMSFCSYMKNINGLDF